MTQKNKSIAEIKNELKTVTIVADPRLAEFAQDERKGVVAALKSTRNRLAKEQALKAHFEEMKVYERDAALQGFQFVAGIDEVGRGPLAGPVVAAAVILKQNPDLVGVNDSKQLSEHKRDELVSRIEENAVTIGLGIVDEKEIDSINIYEATKVAMQKAIDDLGIKPDKLLIDAMKLNNDIPQENIIKGDAKSISIASASIIAKVYRDKLMADYAVQYPGYGFEKNAGYGTALHLEGLKQYGVTPIHRKTFAPVKEILENLQ
jgi:ribonuclease HII